MSIINDLADLLEEITPEQILIERTNMVYRRIVDTTMGAWEHALQAAQVCFYLSYNDHLAVCLQALLFTIGCYSLSNDRNGAYALIAIQLVYILFKHHVKSVIASFVLMTVLTMVVRPFYAFVYMLRYKAYFEIFFYLARYYYYINAILPYYLTDYIYLGLYITSEMKEIYRHRHNLHLDDFLEAGLLVAFTYIFYTRSFTEDNVCLTAVATIIFMFLKSRYTRMWERLIN